MMQSGCMGTVFYPGLLISLKSEKDRVRRYVDSNLPRWYSEQFLVACLIAMVLACRMEEYRTKVQQREEQAAMIRQKQASEAQARRSQGPASPQQRQGAQLDVEVEMPAAAASEPEPRQTRQGGTMAPPHLRLLACMMLLISAGGVYADPVLDERSSERASAKEQGSADEAARKASLIGEDEERKSLKQAASSYHEARSAFRDVEERPDHVSPNLSTRRDTESCLPAGGHEGGGSRDGMETETTPVRKMRQDGGRKEAEPVKEGKTPVQDTISETVISQENSLSKDGKRAQKTDGTRELAGDEDDYTFKEQGSLERSGRDKAREEQRSEKAKEDEKRIEEEEGRRKEKEREEERRQQEEENSRKEAERKAEEKRREEEKRLEAVRKREEEENKREAEKKAEQMRSEENRMREEEQRRMNELAIKKEGMKEKTRAEQDNTMQEEVQGSRSQRENSAAEREGCAGKDELPRKSVDKEQDNVRLSLPPSLPRFLPPSHFLRACLPTE
eukprot:765957-Hanusia_phi.AAC.5